MKLHQNIQIRLPVQEFLHKLVEGFLGKTLFYTNISNKNWIYSIVMRKKIPISCGVKIISGSVSVDALNNEYFVIFHQILLLYILV